MACSILTGEVMQSRNSPDLLFEAPYHATFQEQTLKMLPETLRPSKVKSLCAWALRRNSICFILPQACCISFSQMLRTSRCASTLSEKVVWSSFIAVGS